MDVSLDEIIKKNKITSGRNRRRGGVAPAKKEGGGGGAGAKKPLGMRRPGGVIKTNALKQALGQATGSLSTKKKKVTDLRLLIGAKPRDAREKLNKVSRLPDAREKLLSKASAAATANQLLMRRRGRRYEGVAAMSPRRRMDPRKPAYMDLEEARLRRRSAGSGSLLYRTVDNDGRGGWPSAGVGGYQRPPPSIPRPLMSSDPWAPQPLMQDITRFQGLTRTFNQEDVWAQPQLPRRNGMKRRMERDEEELHHTPGYRIVVSNLQPSVTHEDIKELFEDIGSLYSSRVVRPGTAEVVYKNMEDAVKAVDTYHNRQLDGQPMKCLLVKPSNMNRLMSKGSVVPDLYAIHKALFTK